MPRTCTCFLSVDWGWVPAPRGMGGEGAGKRGSQCPRECSQPGWHCSRGYRSWATLLGAGRGTGRGSWQRELEGQRPRGKTGVGRAGKKGERLQGTADWGRLAHSVGRPGKTLADLRGKGAGGAARSGAGLSTSSALGMSLYPGSRFSVEAVKGLGAAGSRPALSWVHGPRKGTCRPGQGLGSGPDPWEA